VSATVHDLSRARDRRIAQELAEELRCFTADGIAYMVDYYARMGWATSQQLREAVELLTEASG
jgi:hypothetical protein